MDWSQIATIASTIIAIAGAVTAYYKYRSKRVENDKSVEQPKFNKLNVSVTAGRDAKFKHSFNTQGHRDGE